MSYNDIADTITLNDFLTLNPEVNLLNAVRPIYQLADLYACIG